MMQQINLYSDKFKPNAEANLFKLYLASLALLLLMLTSYISYIFWDNSQLEAQLDAAGKKNTQAQNLLIDIEKRFPEQQIDSLLLAENAEISNQVNSLTTVVNQLSNTQSGQYQGFSHYFLALAQQSNSEVWLNRILIFSGNNTITLHGSTYISASVPRLLQRLQQEPVFLGKKFSRLEMKESLEHSSQIDFIVGSQLEEESSKP